MGDRVSELMEAALAQMKRQQDYIEVCEKLIAKQDEMIKLLESMQKTQESMIESLRHSLEVYKKCSITHEG